jgi:pentatricopeptide repeat protein
MRDLAWAMKKRDVKSFMSYVTNKKGGYPPEAEAVVVNFLIKQRVWWGVSELMNIHDFPLGAESYKALVKAFACPERWWQGLGLIRGMHMRQTTLPTEEMYTQVADAIVQGGGLDEGWGFMRGCLQRKKQLPSFIFLRRLMNAYAELGRVDVCELMRYESRQAYPSLHSRVTLLNHSLKACVRAGEVDRALALLQAELRLKPKEICVDKVTWNTVLTACAKAGRVDVAMRVQKLLADRKWPMDLRILTSLLEVYAGVGDVEATKKLFYQDLPRYKCKPTVYCYAALIKAYGNAEDADGVLRGLAELRAAGLEPNAVVYSLAIVGCSRGKRLEEAQALYAEALRSTDETWMLHYAMLNAYSRWGKAEEATALVHMLEQQKVRRLRLVWSAREDV